jgi:hypothetical protein
MSPFLLRLRIYPKAALFQLALAPINDIPGGPYVH